MEFMPNVQSLLREHGTTFPNFFVNVSVCCPSRATILRGQYAHNTGIRTNAPPTGGFGLFHLAGLEDSTVATWLQAAGFRTGFFGKYLNGYPPALPPEEGPAFVPPGWSEWFAPFGLRVYGQFDYRANDNGEVVSYGNDPDDYAGDTIARTANDFVRRAAEEGTPFFAFIAPYSPHPPAASAPRHDGLYAFARAPRASSFDEADVSDKPQYVRNRQAFTTEQERMIDATYRQRLRSLRSVDDMVGAIVRTLEGTGQLDNTYIFFTSDNGYMQGEHRLPGGKDVPYEESIRVSLIVRGPGVPAGRTIDQLTGQHGPRPDLR